MSNKEEILDQEELEVDTVETVDEETAAAQTIAPKGKAASMNAVMDAMSKMSGTDLNGFVAMMKQYGAGKAPLRKIQLDEFEHRIWENGSSRVRAVHETGHC